MGIRLHRNASLGLLLFEVSVHRDPNMVSFLDVERYDDLLSDVLSTGVSHLELPDDISIEGTEFTVQEFFKRNSTIE